MKSDLSNVIYAEAGTSAALASDFGIYAERSGNIFGPPFVYYTALKAVCVAQAIYIKGTFFFPV